MLMVACLALLSGLAPSAAAAADPADISIFPPDNLLSGAATNGYIYPGGSYEAGFDVQGSEIIADLTFALPPANANLQRGPIVVFWEFSVYTIDRQFADGFRRAVHPPRTERVDEACDELGTCKLHLVVRAPTEPALEAADLDWVLRTSVQLLVSVARTYENGATVELVAPGYVDQLAGALSDPGSIEGPLLSSGLIDRAASGRVDLPGTEFGIGGGPYQWVAALEEALGGTTSSCSSEPVPTGTAPESPNDEWTSSTPTIVALAVVAAAAVGLGLLFLRTSHSRRADP